MASRLKHNDRQRSIHPHTQKYSGFASHIDVVCVCVCVQDDSDAKHVRVPILWQGKGKEEKAILYGTTIHTNFPSF